MKPLNLSGKERALPLSYNCWGGALEKGSQWRQEGALDKESKMTRTHASREMAEKLLESIASSPGGKTVDMGWGKPESWAEDYLSPNKRKAMGPTVPCRVNRTKG